MDVSDTASTATTVESDVTSSPAPGNFKTMSEEVAYWKHQYEQLESDLHDFQTSSKEIEAELERDIDASEKRERSLKERAESLKYEAEEWKSKYRQSKAEANSAQNALQKEITGLRETSRTLQLRLRDIEVANDDFERQARNTTSSLEDLESKYNVALERGVMLEEEIKVGEQEREQLRIDAQRLRDELSDLKVEAEITQDKLRAAERAPARLKRVSQLSGDIRDGALKSPGSEASATSAVPSTFTPPAPPSEASAPQSIATTPPSPPLSDISAQRRDMEALSEVSKTDISARDAELTPRPSIPSFSKARQGRGPVKAGQSTTFARSSVATRPRPSGVGAQELPRSGSLYQIRGLIGKMQKLEERVQSVRSKLPAPTNTPPRASPRGTTTLANGIPASVTVRSNRKRSSIAEQNSTTPSRLPTEASGRRQSRVSIGGQDGTRPSSQASHVSQAAYARPGSRAAVERQEPYHRPASSAEVHRPRSSLSGRYTRGGTLGQGDLVKAEEAIGTFATPTARRVGTTTTGLVTPGTLTRRQSAQVLGAATPSRKSNVKRAAEARPSLGKSLTGAPGTQRGSDTEGRGQSAALGETF